MTETDQGFGLCLWGSVLLKCSCCRTLDTDVHKMPSIWHRESHSTPFSRHINTNMSARTFLSTDWANIRSSLSSSWDPQVGYQTNSNRQNNKQNSQQTNKQARDGVPAGPLHYIKPGAEHAWRSAPFPFSSCCHCRCLALGFLWCCIIVELPVQVKHP